MTVIQSNICRHRFGDLSMVGIWMHSIKYSCLYLIVLLVATNGDRQYYDSHNIVLTLQSQDQDLDDYSCKVKESQSRHSKLVISLLANQFSANGDASSEHSDIKVPIPYDADKEFFKIGFDDMCHYLQSVDLNQDHDEYQLPKPLLLNNSNHFYNDVTQLTNQEMIFMKTIESFDESSDNVNPFDNDMTRMNNLLKIAEFLQMERLLTIIAARQASLMINMDKKQMIQWLIDDSKAHNNNNNNDNHNEWNPSNNKKENNNNNAKLTSLLPETRLCNIHNDDNNEACTNAENDGTIIYMNKVNRYNWALLSQILPFLSCRDIHTFSSISNEFYNFANDWYMNRNVDQMIKILTNNKDATCLSLTNQEVLFYKPFLIFPQHKWSKNQNDTYNGLKTMPNTIVNVESKNKFYFTTLGSSRDNYYGLHTLQCTINIDNASIEIYVGRRNKKGFGSISFKFGKFTQQLNILAQSRNIENITILLMHSLMHLSSFDNLIGINEINNIKAITIVSHSFAFINFEEIYNINHQLESLEIVTMSKKTRSVKNIQFLSKMKSLKRLYMYGNNLDSFDFNALKGTNNLQEIDLSDNKLNHTLDTQCLDFAFLNNVPNLKEMNLEDNEIECIVNFMAIQKHSNLVELMLQNNKISSLDLNAFQGTNLQQIDLSNNKLNDLNHDGTSRSQLQSCLDFNSFNNMRQLQVLNLEDNQIKCIVNFESIQQHTQLESLNLGNNHLLSSIDFTKFDASQPLMNNLREIKFINMSLEYIRQNNNCLDLQFLQFMPNLEELYFSNNKIECIDNVSILQHENVKLRYLGLSYNNLASFDFADLIGSNIFKIFLTNNNFSIESLKNFDINTVSKINPSGWVLIDIARGNNVKLPQTKLKQVSVS